MKALVIGKSHVAAFSLALAERPDQDIAVRHLRQSEIETLQDGALLAELATEHAGLDVLCLCIGGNAHNVLGLINDSVPFYLYPAQPNGMLIPSDMMAEHFARFLQRNLELAKLIVAALPAKRLFVINPPPPGADEAHIRAHPGFFAAKLDMGVSPDALRRHLFALETTVHRDHARALGAGFLQSPDQCIDDRGMLAPDYWRSNDPTHSNAAHGHLMLDLIRREMAVSN